MCVHSAMHTVHTGHHSVQFRGQERSRREKEARGGSVRRQTQFGVAVFEISY